MAYDTKCYEIAKDFLEDGELRDIPEKTIAKLAQGIQDYIEDFLSDLEYDRQLEEEAARDKAIDQKMNEQRLNGRRM